MAAQVWSQVVREPIVKEADSKADGPGLRADLGIRGVWTPQVEALFNIKVIDTNAPSHLHRTPESMLDSGALEKKKLYKKAVEDRRGTFTPFVTSVDGLLHREAEHILKQHSRKMEQIICWNVCICQSSILITYYNHAIGFSIFCLSLMWFLFCLYCVYFYRAHDVKERKKKFKIQHGGNVVTVLRML